MSASADDAENERVKERRKEVQEQFDFNSTKIGELCRFVGLALASAYFVFSSSSSEFAQRLIAEHTPTVIVISFFGCLTIALEWVQYLAARSLIARAANRADFLFVGDLWPDTPLKKFQRMLFWLKQWLALAGVLIFFWLMIRTIPTFENNLLRDVCLLF